MRLAFLAAAAALALAPLAAVSQSGEDAIKARQGYFQLLNANMAPLAAMAKGEVAYDAEAAKLYAGNVAALATVNVGPLFVPGTDSDARFGQTAALPAIWADMAAFGAKAQAFGAAAAAFPAAAGAGRAELGAGLQKVGGACASCHDDFRAKD